MFHIAGDANGNVLQDTRGPVLLINGIYSQVDDWLAATDTSLPNTAVQLAEMGYDVWLAPSRGKRYGRSHVTLDPDDPLTREAFWNYSFEDIGMHDLPVLVDTIIS